MAALRHSPAALRLAARPSAVAFAAPISTSLRRFPFQPRPRPRAFKLSFPRFFPSPCRNRRGATGATMVDTAASSYAFALADVANSNGTLEATIADVEKVDCIFSDPTVQSFFANPTISPEKKQEVVKEIASSSELQPHTTNFLNILVDMGRIDIIEDIVKEFEVCYNRITGTEVAVVSSVVRLETQDLAQIAQSVQRLSGAKNVRIKTVIDSSLVAGFTIRYGPSGSKLIDVSVKKQLDEIAAQLDFSSIALA